MDKKTSPATERAETARPDGVRVSSPKCVRCAKQVEARHRPFCSQRCADIDLGAWVMGSYRVETEDAPTDGSDAEVPKPGPGQLG